MLRRGLVLLLFLVVWQIAAQIVGQQAKLPGPALVADAALPLLQSGELVTDMAISLRRVFVGFALALAVGVPVGLFLGGSRRFGRLLYPPIELLRPIPAIAMLPIFLAFFGITEALPVSIVFFAAFFPIVINTQAGVREVQPVYEEAAKTLGAKNGEVVREVILPAALPSIFGGIRIGLQFGWMSIVGAEFIGATSGLGYMILYYEKFLYTSNVMVGMVTIGILGFFLDRVALLARRLLVGWQVA